MFINKTSLLRYLVPRLRSGWFARDGEHSRTIISLSCILFAASFLYAQEIFVYDSQGRRDPFLPLVTADGRLIKLEAQDSQISLILEGIIYDPAGISYAMVNGMVVKAGDTLNDYQVLKIQKDIVIFIKEGQVYEVKIKKEDE